MTQRPIRFRVFEENGAFSKMWYDIGAMLKANREDERHTIADVILDNPFSNITLMQFTDLLDSKGIEIYEGDFMGMPVAGVAIVGKLIGRNYGWYQPVQYDSTRAKFVFSSRPDEYGLSTYHKEMEVIGNIYENPELIK